MLYFSILSLTSIDSVSLFGRSSPLQHPVKGPLIVVTTANNNSAAAFDIYTGECRAVLRVKEQRNTGNNTAAFTSQPTASSNSSSSSSTAATGTAANVSVSHRGSISSSSQQPSLFRVAVSPLSLPSLRSYIQGDYQPPGIDETFVKELAQVRRKTTSKAVESFRNNTRNGVNSFFTCFSICFFF